METPHPSTPALQVRMENIRRAFDNGVVALDGINLLVAPGEFLAILGPSGCGKSTLLRLIAGLDRPQAGIVTVEAQGAGKDLGHSSGAMSGAMSHARVGMSAGRQKDMPTASVGHGTQSHASSGSGKRGAFRGRPASIAYVFQDAHLLPWRSVLQNVALPLEFKHVERPRRMEAARAALEQVGLTEAVDRYPNQLSGGQRMRVSLARAMVTDPKLLLLDEPFAALDEITRQRLDEQLRELWLARKMTVIFVTHSTQEAVFLAERAVAMTRGPGRIMHDDRIDLPTDRPSAIRATPEFAGQMRVLYEALARGEA